MSTKLSRREFLRLAGLAGAGVALAACQPKATEAPTQPPAVEEEKPTSAPVAKEYEGELRVLGLPGAPVEPICELLTAAMTSKYPKVTVKYEYITTDLNEKIYTGAAAGNLADVFFNGDSFVGPFAANGASLDLTPFVEADTNIDVNDIYPNMMGLSTFKGQIHMLPSALDVVTMYYNKTLFEQAGAELPQETWTWDDFIANAKKITAIETDESGLPKYWGLSNGTWNWWATVYPWVVGYGGKIFDENGKSTWSDPNTIEGLTRYVELWTKHNIAQPLGLDVGGDSFVIGRAAVWCHIQGVRTYVRDGVGDKFDWDVQLMPKMKDGRHRTGMGTWGLSVFAGSKMKEAAYEYLSYMVTPACQRLLAKKELAVPLVRSVAEDPSWMEGLKTPPTNFMAYVKGADDAVLPVVDFYPSDCGSFYSGIVAQALNTAIEAAIRGQKTVEEAYKEVDETIQLCLDENA